MISAIDLCDVYADDNVYEHRWVNGDIVTKSDFERMQVDFLRQRPELQNVTSDSPELQKAVAESTPQLILNAVDALPRGGDIRIATRERNGRVEVIIADTGVQVRWHCAGREATLNGKQ